MKILLRHGNHHSSCNVPFSEIVDQALEVCCRQLNLPAHDELHNALYQLLWRGHVLPEGYPLKRVLPELNPTCMTVSACTAPEGITRVHINLDSIPAPLNVIRVDLPQTADSVASLKEALHKATAIPPEHQLLLTSDKKAALQEQDPSPPQALLRVFCGDGYRYLFAEFGEQRTMVVVPPVATGAQLYRAVATNLGLPKQSFLLQEKPGKIIATEPLLPDTLKSHGCVQVLSCDPVALRVGVFHQEHVLSVRVQQSDSIAAVVDKLYESHKDSLPQLDTQDLDLYQVPVDFQFQQDSFLVDLLMGDRKPLSRPVLVGALGLTRHSRLFVVWRRTLALVFKFPNGEQACAEVLNTDLNETLGTHQAVVAAFPQLKQVSHMKHRFVSRNGVLPTNGRLGSSGVEDGDELFFFRVK